MTRFFSGAIVLHGLKVNSPSNWKYDRERDVKEGVVTADNEVIRGILTRT